MPDQPPTTRPRVPGLTFDYTGDPPLVLPHHILETLISHCLREAPLEACGVLAGCNVPVADAVYPLRNLLASPKEYDAHPDDLIATFKLLREKHQQMLAIYHSHPGHPPEPSKADLNRNHYGPMPRIIVSLTDAEPVVRVWRLDERSYQELAWSVAVSLAQGL